MVSYTIPGVRNVRRELYVQPLTNPERGTDRSAESQ
jgi:hypothetical protein